MIIAYLTHRADDPNAADDDEYDSTKLPVVAISVSVTIASIILIVIIYRLLRPFFHKKLHPLPPPQPLAHHRAQFLDRNDSASRPSTAYSTNQPTLNMSSAMGSSTSSLIASRSPSATRPSPVHSVGDVSLHFTKDHTQPPNPRSLSKEPFPSYPSDIPDSPSIRNPSVIPRQASRSRPVSTAPSQVAQIRGSRRISSSNSLRLRCTPHSPHSGVQVVLPAPLAPALYSCTSGEVPPTLAGVAGDKWSISSNRMSLVDAWAPIPFRGPFPEKNTESSLRHERTLSIRSQSSGSHGVNNTSSSSSSSGDHSQNAPLPPIPSAHITRDIRHSRRTVSEGSALQFHDKVLPQAQLQHSPSESTTKGMVAFAEKENNTGKASIDA